MILFAEDAIKLKEQVFLFAKDLNLLFSVNIPDGKIFFYGSIPEEEPFSERLTCKLVYWEEQIIIIPLMAKKIWIYSLADESWRSIEIKPYNFGSLRTNFRKAIIYQNYLFLVGGHYPAILKMDLVSYEISYIREPFFRYSKIYGDSEELYFRGELVYEGTVLYLASSRENLVLKFELDTQAYEWIEVGGKKNRYSGIMWDGKNYWLSPRMNTPIVRWDGKDDVEEYEIPVEKGINSISYAGIIGKDNKIVIPALAGSGVDSVTITSDGRMHFYKEEYTFYKQIERNNYLAQNSKGNLILINDGGERIEFECNITGKIFCDMLDILHINTKNIAKNIVYENKVFSLLELPELVERADAGSGRTFVNKNVSLKIWQTAKM